MCRATDRLEPTRAATSISSPEYGRTIDAWLKLGLAYNASLTCFSIAVFALEGHTVFVAAPQLVLGAFIANLCFLAGPAVELLARRLGHRGTWLRWVLFLVGFAAAHLLALVCCVVHLATL